MGINPKIPKFPAIVLMTAFLDTLGASLLAILGSGGFGLFALIPILGSTGTAGALHGLVLAFLIWKTSIFSGRHFYLYSIFTGCLIGFIVGGISPFLVDQSTALFSMMPAGRSGTIPIFYPIGAIIGGIVSALVTPLVARRVGA